MAKIRKKSQFLQKNIDLNSHHPAGGVVAVGQGIGGAVENTVWCEVIYPNKTRGVYDITVTQSYADMDYASLWILKEAEVVATYVREIYWNALSSLLRGVAQKRYAAGAEAHLGQSRAVDSHDGFAAPEVWCTEVSVSRHLRG